MKKIEVFSKKLGKTVSVNAVACKGKTSALGWMQSGWSKSGGWRAPQSK